MERESESPTLPAPFIQAAGMPVLPPLARALLTLLAGEEKLDLVLPLLEREPALASRLRCLARSAVAPPGEVATLEEAAAVLGREALLSQAFSYCLVGALPHAGGSGFDHSEFWRRSLIAAVAARAVARAEDKPYADLAFVAGLFAHVGQLVLATSLPEQYLPVIGAAKPRWPSIGVEVSLLGYHHGHVADALLRAWSVPELIRVPVASAHVQAAGGGHRLAPGVRELSHDLSVALRIVELLCGTEGGPGMAILAEEVENNLALDEEELQGFLLDLVPELRASAEFLGLEQLGEDWLSDALSRARAHMAEVALGAAFGEPSGGSRRPYLPSAGLDAATSLFTPVSFDGALSEEIRRRLAGPVPHSLGVLLIDLKGLRDAVARAPAPAAGALLAEVGRILRQTTRKSDAAGRLSEERFGVLVPETTGDQLELVAQRIRRRFTAALSGHSIVPALGSAALSRVASEKDGHVLLTLAEDRLAHRSGPTRGRGDAA
jgi:two-component system, cell cycle response regulator